MSSYGHLINQIRTDIGLSLRDFAERCGLSHTYIDKLEKGVDPRTGKPVSPTLDTIKQICDSTGYPMDQFLKETGYLADDGLMREKDVYFRIARDAGKHGISPQDMEKALEFLIRAKERDKLTQESPEDAK